MNKHNDLTQDKDRPHNGMYLAGCPICEKLDKIYKRDFKKLQSKRSDLPEEEE